GRVNLPDAPPRRRVVNVLTAQKTRLELERFVATEYPAVVAAVGLITGNRGEADDAVQDALVGYLAKPPQHEVTNVAAWITVVASNRARDRQRRKAAESRAYEKLGPPTESTTDIVDTLDIDVKAALAELPLGQRQVCVLHYLLDQSIADIAEGLGVSEGTVKTQLHRARKTLAE